MAKTGPAWIAASCALALALSPVMSRAQGDPWLATVGKPATFTVARTSLAADAEAQPSRAPRLVISVTNYRPADDCTPVEIIVKGRVGQGAEREVGRFGITPNFEFNAADPAEAQHFSFPLPRELATAQPVEFKVELLLRTEARPDAPLCNAGKGPAQKDGAKGPAVRVGKVEIR